MTVHVGARPTVRAPGRDALLLLLAIAVVAGTLLALGMSGGARSRDLSAQAHEVASTLRCPVCADLSAADSPSPMAAEMRRQILRDLQQGRSPEQIRAGFVSAYGPSVLMTPPRSGVGSIAYLLPVLVVVAAAAMGTMLLRRLLRRPSETREEEPG